MLFEENKILAEEINNFQNMNKSNLLFSLDNKKINISEFEEIKNDVNCKNIEIYRFNNFIY